MKKLVFLYVILSFFNCYTSENKLLDVYKLADERCLEIQIKIDFFRKELTFERHKLTENRLDVIDQKWMNLEHIKELILKNQEIIEPDLGRELEDQAFEEIKLCITIFEKNIQRLDEQFQEIRKLFEEALVVE